MNSIPQQKLVDSLAIKAIDISKANSKELDRCSWLVVHEHHHGVMPVEYDIREVDEQLYLRVLKKAVELNAGS